MVVENYTGILNLKWDKFGRRFTPSVSDEGLRTGDRLIIYETEKYNDFIFNERLVRDRCFNGLLRFELTFIPFFFCKKELNFFLDCCDLQMSAKLVRYFG